MTREELVLNKHPSHVDTSLPFSSILESCRSADGTFSSDENINKVDIIYYLILVLITLLLLD